MLPRLARIGQILGQWLSPSPQTVPTEGTDGDLPHGAGFREPPPDRDWRQRAPEQASDQSNHSKPDSRENPSPTAEAPRHITDHFHPIVIYSKKEGLSKYLKTPGAQKQPRFRKGVVLDEAA